MKSYLKFRQLFEGFDLNSEDQIIFTPGENELNVDTSFNFKKLPTRNFNTAGLPVYYAYKGINKDPDLKKVDIQYALKGYSKSNYKFATGEKEKFLKRTAIYFQKFLKEKAIDTVLIMGSSSNLNNELAIELNKRLQGINIFDNIINKALDISKIKFVPKEGMSEITIKNNNRLIQRAVEKGEFKIKSIHPQFRTQMIDWLEIKNDFNVEKHITNKNILIIDDYLTTGSSLLEASRILKLLNPKSTVGLVLFK